MLIHVCWIQIDRYIGKDRDPASRSCTYKFELKLAYDGAVLETLKEYRHSQLRELPSLIPIPKAWCAALAAMSLPRVARDSVAAHFPALPECAMVECKLLGVPAAPGPGSATPALPECAMVDCKLLGVPAAPDPGSAAVATHEGVTASTAFIANPLLWPAAAGQGGNAWASQREVWAEWTWGERLPDGTIVQQNSAKAHARLDKLQDGQKWAPPGSLCLWVEHSKLRTALPRIARDSVAAHFPALPECVMVDCKLLGVPAALDPGSAAVATHEGVYRCFTGR